MMHRVWSGLALLAAQIIPPTAQAQMAPEAAAAIQRPVTVERANTVETIALVPHMGKYAIRAGVNGEERSFVFDTGSPTLVSRAFAETLNLKVIGTNTGRDANGRAVTTDIALVERLTIGGLTFTDVPVLIADFSAADPGLCFFDGGVIGSEIFPGSVWHFDAEAQELRIAASLGDIDLEDTVPAPFESELFIGGYPYAPVFAYSFGSFRDRALFDTGSSDTVTLFERVLGDEQVQKALVSGSMAQGRGSQGVSAGGAGAVTDLRRFNVSGFTIGAPFPTLPATTRNAPPTLIGLGMLDRYDVTLDYPGKRMLLRERSHPATPKAHPGYAISMIDGTARVVQLYAGSPAEQAGLRLGDEVAAIDGRALTDPAQQCETMRWLIEDRPADTARVLSVLRDGEVVALSLAAQ